MNSPNLDTNQQEEIDIFQLIEILWQGKWLILIFALVFAIGSVLVAMYLPKTFRSEATLVPVSSDSPASGLSQLSGLASMAGISLGGSKGGIDKTLLAIETLKSKQFLLKFIEKYKIQPYLFAIQSWDENQNGIWDETKFDKTNNQIRKDIPQPLQEDLIQNFSNFLTITNDYKTNIVKISMEYGSPQLAYQWLVWLIKDINEEIRKNDLDEAQKSLEFLEKQIAKTNLTDLKNILYQLIEENTKTLMLVNIRQEYVFKIIDPPRIAERKSKPKRTIIVLVGGALGLALGVLTTIVLNVLKERKTIKMKNEK